MEIKLAPRYLTQACKILKGHVKVNNQNKNPTAREEKARLIFSRENLAHYKTDATLPALSAAHEKECLQERKQNYTFPRSTRV